MKHGGDVDATRRGDASLGQELAELTSRLIAYRTVAGNHAELRACLQFVGEYLARLQGVHFSRYEHRDCPYLVVSTTDTKHPDIMLSGHIDVVPAALEQFRAKVSGDRLFGRGALDMKGGVATLVKLFLDVAEQLRGTSVALMLTSDEEIGALGARYLVHDHGWRTHFLLIPEGGEKMQLVSREKGFCWIRAVAQGKTAHSAYPWRGDNAVDRLSAALAKLKKLVPPPADAWQSSISVSQFNAGERAAHNQVPDRAEAVLDVRYTPDFALTGEGVVELFGRVAPDISFELMANGDTLSVPYSHPHLQRLQSIANRRLGREVPLGFNHGASDAAAFASFGIPAMTSGVVGANHHADNEYVSIASLIDYYHIAREFIVTWQHS